MRNDSEAIRGIQWHIGRALFDARQESAMGNYSHAPFGSRSLIHWSTELTGEGRDSPPGIRLCCGIMTSPEAARLVSIRETTHGTHWQPGGLMMAIPPHRDSLQHARAWNWLHRKTPAGQARKRRSRCARWVGTQTRITTGVVVVVLNDVYDGACCSIAHAQPGSTRDCKPTRRLLQP